jgi:hypothetical protein
VKQIIAFIIATLILSIYGFYGIWQLRTLGAELSEGIEHKADLVIRQLLENPGNWSVSPPSIGLAYSEMGSSGELVYPYVIDTNKLNRLMSLNHSTIKAGLSLIDYDVRIVFYYYNETSKSFPSTPSLIIGSNVIGQIRGVRHAMARLSNGTLCEVRVTVSGGG